MLLGTILAAMPKGTTLEGLVITQVGITPLGTFIIHHITRREIASTTLVVHALPTTLVITILATSTRIQGTRIQETPFLIQETRSITLIQETRSTTRILETHFTTLRMLAVRQTQEMQETLEIKELLSL